MKNLSTKSFTSSPVFLFFCRMMFAQGLQEMELVIQRKNIFPFHYFQNTLIISSYYSTFKILGKNALANQEQMMALVPLASEYVAHVSFYNLMNKCKC